MNDIKELVVTTIKDTVEINHYLKEIMHKTSDSFENILLAEQIRKNNETIMEIICIYLESTEEDENENGCDYTLFRTSYIWNRPRWQDTDRHL
jgi:hypothetical protein